MYFGRDFTLWARSSFLIVTAAQKLYLRTLNDSSVYVVIAHVNYQQHKFLVTSYFHLM